MPTAREINGRLFEALETIGEIKGQELAAAIDHVIKIAVAIIQLENWTAPEHRKEAKMVTGATLRRLEEVCDILGIERADLDPCLRLTMADLKDITNGKWR